METRKAKMIVNKAGAGNSTFRATLPALWIREMGLGEEERELLLKFDGEKIIIEKKENSMENIVKVLYDGEEIGTVRTNQNITLDHALEMAGVDVNEMEDENTPKWDYELFTLEY